MIISKTSCRVSFIGGGSDYPESVAKWGGIVLGTCINKHSYITVRRLPQFFNYKTRLMYSQLETINNNKDIQHRVIKEAIIQCGFTDVGLEISHMADMPSYSGIGSSSAFIVGLIHALEKLAGKDSYCRPESLYNASVFLEQNILKDTVGYQDTAWAAFGGTNVISWKKDKTPTIERLLVTYPEISEKSLLLFHTGIIRDASSVASSYVPSLRNKEREHKDLMELTHKGIEAFKDYDMVEFGRLICEGWNIKKNLSPSVTNSVIEKMIDAGMRMGAFGAKLLGAGGGGCILLVVNSDKREEFIRGMQEVGALHIDFEFEPEGSRIIYG